MCAQVTTLALVFLLWPASGLAAPTEEGGTYQAKDLRTAEELFNEGVRLNSYGRPEEALACFERAYRLVPKPLVLFVMGRLYESLGRPAEAADALERVLAGGSLSEKQAEEARATLSRSESVVARLSLDTDVPARVLIDGVEVARTPLRRTLLVDPGRPHLLTLVALGLPEAHRSVTFSEGSKNTIVIALRPPVPPVAATPAAPLAGLVRSGDPIGATPVRRRYWPAIATVATGVAASVIGGTLLANDLDDRSDALSARSNLRATAQRGSGAPCDPAGPDQQGCLGDLQAVNRRVDEAESAVGRSLALTSFGVATGIAGVVWLMHSLGGPGEPRALLQPVLLRTGSSTGGALVVGGRF
jgi:tetratricopeptide (TPR) repeat protein